MSFRITCYTLFDITQTGVLNRPRPSIDEDYKIWTHRRNTQANFDTILQIINLRSQPEVVKQPSKIEIKFDDFDKFGFLFTQQENETYPCWTFDFDIQHLSVFDDGRNELGSLYNDCDGVPMIICGTEWHKVPAFLDTSVELRNIYFTTNHE
jgi:hypothetical protein